MRRQNFGTKTKGQTHTIFILSLVVAHPLRLACTRPGPPRPERREERFLNGSLRNERDRTKTYVQESAAYLGCFVPNLVPSDTAPFLPALFRLSIRRAAASKIINKPTNKKHRGEKNEKTACSFIYLSNGTVHRIGTTKDRVNLSPLSFRLAPPGPVCAVHTSVHAIQ